MIADGSANPTLRTVERPLLSGGEEGFAAVALGEGLARLAFGFLLSQQ